MLSNITSKLKQVQNTVLQRSPIEIKVREATSNEPGGVSNTFKREISDATHYSFEDYKIIMSTIWTRLEDSGKNWRHVQKGILLLEFLMANGSERVISEVKENIHMIRSLRNFHYVDEKGDQGHHVREAARSLLKLIADEKEIKNRRKQAKQSRNKYVGVGSDSSFKSYESNYGSKTTSYYDDEDEDNGYKQKPSKHNYDEEEKKEEEEEEEKNEPEPPKPVVKPVAKSSRPRAPSLTAPPTSSNAQTAPPSQAKPKAAEQNLISLDDFFTGGSSSSQFPPQQQQRDIFETVPNSQSQFTNNGSSGFHSNGGNELNGGGNGFDGGFDGGNVEFRGFEDGDNWDAEFKENDFKPGDRVDEKFEQNLSSFQMKPSNSPGQKGTANSKPMSIMEKRKLKGSTSNRPIPQIPTAVPAYPPNQAYPANPTYPPNTGYPPSGYPPNAGPYPPRNTGYPPSGYPPNTGYPPRGNYPQQGYPPQTYGYQ